MSLEFIKLVISAEENALSSKRHAEKQAEDAIMEARRKGRSGVAETLERADSEIAHLIHAADRKAMEDARELASTTANRLATLRARAERRQSDAAALAFKRIAK